MVAQLEKHWPQLHSSGNPEHGWKMELGIFLAIMDEASYDPPEPERHVKVSKCPKSLNQNSGCPHTMVTATPCGKVQEDLSTMADGESSECGSTSPLHWCKASRMCLAQVAAKRAPSRNSASKPKWHPRGSFSHGCNTDPVTEIQSRS